MRRWSSSAGSSRVSYARRRSPTSGWRSRVTPVALGRPGQLATRGEGVSGGDGQFVGEVGDMGVRAERALLEGGDLFVGDMGPVGVRGAGARVGEDEAGEVRRVAVQQPDRARQPFVARGVGEDLAEPVEQDGRGGLQAVEQGPHGGAHGTGRVRAAQQLKPPLGALGQPVQMDAFGGR